MHKSVLLSFIILFAETSIAHSQPLRFRTDGYYYWDNKKDTIHVYNFPDPSLLAEVRQMLRDDYDVLGDQELKCLRKGEVPEGGKSTFMHVMAFFSDTSGTAFGICCRDIATYEDAVNGIQMRRAGLDKRRLAQSQAIHSIKWFGENEFSFLVSRSKDFKEIYRGRLYGDSMVVYVIREKSPDMYRPDEARVYKFYRFGEVPKINPQVIVRQ